MKICFITNSVHPTSGGSKKYLFEIMKALKHQGHKITLVCSEGTDYSNNFVDEIIYIKRIPLPLIENIITTTTIGLLSFIKLIKKDHDFYCFESGFIGIWALLFKIIKRKPTISFSMRYGLNILKLNIRLFDLKFSKLITFLFYFIWEVIFFINEVFDVFISDKIIVLNDEAKNVWINNKINPKKIDIVPFGVDLKKYKPIKKDYNPIKELSFNNKFITILYIGHLEFSRNIDKLVLALPELKKITNQQFKLVIVGSGPIKDYLSNIIINSKIEDNIIFVPHINDEIILNKLFNISDLLVLPQVPGTSSILSVAAGTPVATIKNTKNLLGAVDKKILEIFFYFDSPEPKSIAQGIYYLINHPKILDNMSKNGMNIIEEYSWDIIALKLIDILKTLKN